jgi:hypothetical protein
MDANRNTSPRSVRPLEPVKSSEEDPVTLILNAHATHTKNTALLEKARENHVYILRVMRHASHEMQLLHVPRMSPTTHDSQGSGQTWLTKNPRKAVTVRKVGFLSGKTYRTAASPRNAVPGFRDTGMSP